MTANPVVYCLLVCFGCTAADHKTAEPVGLDTAGDSLDASVEPVTLSIWGEDAPTLDAVGTMFAGRYDTTLPVDNPAPAVGTNHGDDPAAEARLAAYTEATVGAIQVRIHRGAPPREGALLTVTGCEPNRTVLDEVARLGHAVCAPESLGRDITFANVQLARVAPDGPFDIYEDYVVQTLPLLFETGGCVTGAWLCDDEIFSGVFVPSYTTRDGMFSVASETSSSGPGGEYGDATYSDLRYGGVEVIVRHLVDVDVVGP
jgi:hypothetical protein